jgi:hypothetical protein
MSDSVLIVERTPPRTIEINQPGPQGPAGSRVVEIAGFFGGGIEPLEDLLRLEITAPVLLTGGRASAETLVDSVFTILFDGDPIGSVTFAAGVPAFDVPDEAIGPGLLILRAPLVSGGITNLSITLSGTR